MYYREMVETLKAPKREIRTRLGAIAKGASSAELRDSVLDLCEQNGYDPIKELIELVQGRNTKFGEMLLGIAEDLESALNPGTIDVKKFAKALRMIAERIPGLSTSDEIAVHKEVAQFLTPKIKSMDVQQTVKASINISVKNFMINVDPAALAAKDVTPVQAHRAVPHV